MAPRPYMIEDAGVRLRMRVTPKSSKDQIDGIYEAGDGSLALKVRVRAQPEKGKANAAVVAVIAKALGCAKSDVSVTAGSKDRTKTLFINGETSRLTRAIDALIDAQN